MRKAFGRLIVPVTFAGLFLSCVSCEKPARRERRPGARIPRRGAVEKPVEDADADLPASEEWEVEEEPAVKAKPEKAEETLDVGAEPAVEADELEEEPEAEEAPAEEDDEEDDGAW